MNMLIFINGNHSITSILGCEKLDRLDHRLTVKLISPLSEEVLDTLSEGSAELNVYSEDGYHINDDKAKKVFPIVGVYKNLKFIPNAESQKSLMYSFEYKARIQLEFSKK